MQDREIQEEARREQARQDYIRSVVDKPAA
jgi:hypothetical protein